MNHLTPDELLDYVEQSPDASALGRHVESCVECRTEAAALSAILGAARRVEVPEPSPLFWNQFSRRVHDAIAADPRRASVAGWLRWPVLVPISGLALLVLALVASLSPRSGDTPISNIAEHDVVAGPDTTATLDTTWALVADLVGPIDLETAQLAGIALSPGAADEAILELSVDEREELVRLLRRELGQPGG